MEISKTSRMNVAALVYDLGKVADSIGCITHDCYPEEVLESLDKVDKSIREAQEQLREACVKHHLLEGIL